MGSVLEVGWALGRAGAAPAPGAAECPLFSFSPWLPGNSESNSRPGCPHHPPPSAPVCLLTLAVSGGRSVFLPLPLWAQGHQGLLAGVPSRRHFPTALSPAVSHAQPAGVSDTHAAWSSAGVSSLHLSTLLATWAPAPSLRRMHGWQEGHREGLLPLPSFPAEPQWRRKATWAVRLGVGTVLESRMAGAGLLDFMSQCPHLLLVKLWSTAGGCPGSCRFQWAPGQFQGSGFCGWQGLAF